MRSKHDERKKRMDQIRKLLTDATPLEWAPMIGAYPLQIVAVEVVDGKRRGGATIANLRPGAREQDVAVMAYGKGLLEWALGELERSEKVVEAARGVEVYDDGRWVGAADVAYALWEYDRGGAS